MRDRTKIERCAGRDRDPYAPSPLSGDFAQPVDERRQGAVGRHQRDRPRARGERPVAQRTAGAGAGDEIPLAAAGESIRGIASMGMAALSLYYDTDESKEGGVAFREKRKPDFRRHVMKKKG